MVCKVISHGKERVMSLAQSTKKIETLPPEERASIYRKKNTSAVVRKADARDKACLDGILIRNRLRYRLRQLPLSGQTVQKRFGIFGCLSAVPEFG